MNLGTSATSLLKDREINDLKDRLVKVEQQNEKEKKKHLDENISTYLDEQVKKWQQKSVKELGIWGAATYLSILWLLWMSDWNFIVAVKKYEELKSGFVIGNLIALTIFLFTGLTLRKWYDRNHNYSNIENYKKNLKLPNYLNNSN